MKRGELNLPGAPVRESSWDALEVRSKASSSEYRIKKTTRACEWLDRLGFTTLYSAEDHFYGKSGDGSMSWGYDPNFSNGGNSSHNNNFQKIDALNVTTQSSAEKYAKLKVDTFRRAADKVRRLGGKAAKINGRVYSLGELDAMQTETYRMTAENPNARIIEGDSVDLSKISVGDRQKFKAAIKDSLPSVLEACPLDYDDRNKFNVSALRSGLFRTLTKPSDVADRAKAFGLSEQSAQRLVSAINTRYLLENMPLESMKAMLTGLLHKKTEISVGGEKYNFSSEYFASYMKDLGIIGMHRYLNSPREIIGKNGKKERIGNFHSIFIFSQSEVDIDKNNERKRDTRNRIFGQIALRMNGILHGRGGEMARKSGVVSELEQRLYSTPREIVEKAKESCPWAKGFYEMDAGNKEGYTLQEHTETTLRIFEDNFADKLPAGLIPAAKLALLVHDIGKPIAAATSGNTKGQASFNAYYSAKFLEDAGVDADTRKLVSDLIGKGMHNSGSYAHYQDRPSLQRMHQISEEIARDNFGDVNLRNNADGIFDLLIALQTCDSGAYTRLAKTHRGAGQESVYYRNLDSFGNSFEKSDLGGRKIRLRRALEKRLSHAV